MAEEFEIVRNANPSLVKQAQADVGVLFQGENQVGNFLGGIVKQKPNAKGVVRQKVEEYNSERDNTKQADTNPFSAEIKEKNDRARQTIIPLLNTMSKSGGVRLNSISLELSQDLAREEAKPKPNPKTIQELKDQKTRVEKSQALGDVGRDGIVFPPLFKGE